MGKAAVIKVMVAVVSDGDMGGRFVDESDRDVSDSVVVAF